MRWQIDSDGSTLERFHVGKTAKDFTQSVSWDGALEPGHVYAIELTMNDGTNAGKTFHADDLRSTQALTSGDEYVSLDELERRGAETCPVRE